MAKYLLFAFAMVLPLTDVSRSYLGAASFAEILLVPLAFVAFHDVIAKGLVMSIGIVLNVAFGLVVILSWFYAGGQFELDAPVLNLKPVGHHMEYLFAFLAVTVLCRTSGARRSFLNGLWTGCTLALGFALVQYVLGADARLFWQWGPDWAATYAQYGSFRVWGSLSNPLNLVTYLAPFLGLGVVLVFASQRRLARFFYSAMLVGLIFALLTTGSKTALLILILPIAVFIRSTRFFTAIVTALGAGFVVWFSGAAHVLLERSQGNVADLYSITQRRNVIAAAIRMIRDYPTLGVGPDHFRDVYPEHYWIPTASSWGQTFTSENIFLQVGAEHGLIALLLFFLILVRGIATAIPVQGPDQWRLSLDSGVARAIAVAITCYIVAAQSSAATAVATNLLLFSLLGLQEALRLQWHSSAASFASLPEDRFLPLRQTMVGSRHVPKGGAI